MSPRRLWVTSTAVALLACGPTDPNNEILARLDDDSGLGTCVSPDATTPSPEASFDAPADGSDPYYVGSWGPVTGLPIVPIHTILLAPSGKLLMFMDVSSLGQRYLYDPADGSVTGVGGPSTNLFCSGHCALPDGRILILGGSGGSPGITTTTLFNPASESWQTFPTMNFARWYGTGVTLGDGRVMAISGQQLGVTETTPEIFNVQTQNWTALTSANITTPLYPFMFQMPDGRVLFAGASEGTVVTQALDVATQQWTTIDGNVTDGGSIRQYALGKFIKAGSSSDSGRTGASASGASILDITAPSPAWQSTGSMTRPRSFLNLTSLPDGTVLATGGGTDKSSNIDANGVLPAELWDPVMGTWRTLASMATPRMYHSNATLLPDGRVFVAGQGGDPGVVDHANFEIFSPPYLFKGARPTITSAPSTLDYSVTTLIGTPNTDIGRVALIRTGATTHSFDQNGRTLFLNFAPAAGGVVIQTPLNGNAAPPGYYMLFLVNSAGVPSVAKFVRFPAPWEITAADAGPDAVADAAALDAGADAATAVDAGPEPAVEAGPDAVAEASIDAGVDAKADPADAGAEAEAAPPPVDAGPPGALTLDTVVFTHQATNGANIARTITTAGPNELVVAFLASDGPCCSTQTFNTVAGGGLTWTMRRKQNAQQGTAEIWQAVAAQKLTNVNITATRGGGSAQGSFVLAAFIGADLTTAGAINGASVASGVTTVSLTSTRAGSQVWGVGVDWDSPIARTVGAGQTKVDEYFSPTGDTYWVQRLTNPVASAGQTATLSCTAPTADRWNFSIIEILPAP